MEIKKEFVTKVEIDEEKFASLKEDDGLYPGFLYANWYDKSFVTTFITKENKYYYYRFDLESPNEMDIEGVKSVCKEYIENDN